MVGLSASRSGQALPFMYVSVSVRLIRLRQTLNGDYIYLTTGASTSLRLTTFGSRSRLLGFIVYHPSSSRAHLLLMFSPLPVPSFLDSANKYLFTWEHGMSVERERLVSSRRLTGLESTRTAALAMPVPEALRDGRPVCPGCEKDQDVKDLVGGEEKIESAGREALRTPLGVTASRVVR